MYSTVSSNESFETSEVSDSSGAVTNKFREQIFYDTGCEAELEETLPDEKEPKKCISVGDYLPFGCKLFYETPNNFIRVKELGVQRRILILGVIGSFTPFCWNRHLFRVLRKSRYYEERGIDYICCISTNDAYTHAAWSEYLGCADRVFMLADSKKAFTKRIGMDIVVPWLDGNIRSRRYVIYAEDMQVSKMIVAPDNNSDFKWQCEHLQQEEDEEIIDDEDSESDGWI